MQTLIHDTTIVTADEQCTVHVHQGQGRDVEAVMVDGRWLLRDGIMRTMDEEAIVREADRIGRAAWRRLFEERPDLQPPRG
jgi:5-methylthioadenosine/S-adenosylhomocysteine deaminase